MLGFVDPRGQTLLGIPIADPDTRLFEDPAGIDSDIDEVHGAAGLSFPFREGPPDGVESGILRQERGMNVEDASGKGTQKRIAEDAHESGTGDEVHAERLESVEHFLQGGIGELAAFFGSGIDDKRGDATALGDFEDARAGNVRHDYGNVGTETAIAGGLDDRAGIGTLPRSEDGDAGRLFPAVSGELGKGGAGGFPGNEGEDADLDAEPVEDGFFLINEGVRRVITSLGVDVRADRLDHSAGTALFKNDDTINALEGAEHLGAVFGGVNRPAGALQFPDRGIAVDRDDEGIAEGGCFFEITHVPDVKNIKNAVGENEFFAPARKFVPQGRDFLEGGEIPVGHPRNYAVFSAFHNPVFH